MKRILFFSIVLALSALSIVNAQNINYSPSTPVFPLPIVPVTRATTYNDTLKATDSLWYGFRAPFNLEIVSLQVEGALVDTGAATPGPVVHVWERTAGPATAPTSIVSATLTAANTLAYGSPSTTAAARVPRGSWLDVGAIFGTSDKLKQVSVILWYTRY